MSYNDMKQRDQWLLAKIVPSRTQPGKTDKIPFSARTFKACDQTDPGVWVDYQSAVNAKALMGEGFELAFAVSHLDPYFFLDVDSCRDQAGNLSPLAQALIDALPGALVEISHSGTGIHIIGSAGPLEHSSRDDANGLEFYTAARMLTLGQYVSGDETVDCTAALGPIVAHHLQPRDYGDMEWTTGPVEAWRGPEDDDELIKRALKSGSPFKSGARFADLWAANVEKLAESYPSGQDYKEYDNSQADMALAQHLAFWTGRDCARIDRLMRQSGLARDKYEREDYMRDTILKACGRQVDVLGEVKQIDVKKPETYSNMPETVSGYQLMGVDQQLDHFAGCVYIVGPHRVFTPEGLILKPDQFRAYYGGYAFSMDSNHRKETKSAWEAFTESQAIRWPKAHALEFDPLRAPGEIWEYGGQRVVNTWVPIEVPRKAGDPGPFITHLEKLLPDPNDRAVLLAYMAACVQFQGVKFQWCPLIQGTEGNGKSLFSYCIKRAIGDKYSHTPNPQHIAKNFNAWLFGKTFFMVEDIYVPEQKLEIWETLKPMITGKEGIQIELKGVDATMARVCGNFLLNTNHKDAVRKTRGDRRVAPFFTAQQTPDDLVAAGMDGDYFPNLYNWLDKQDGYAIVSEFLYTYAIPDALNPATKLHRAPRTTSTDELLNLSMGGIEQEILEAVDEGRPGFAGGYVSSWALDQLLIRLRADRRISRNKRSQMMADLGYILHPGITNGRLPSASPCDAGTRPRIYVRPDSLQAQLTGANVTASYQKAQGDAAADSSPFAATR